MSNVRPFPYPEHLAPGYSPSAGGPINGQRVADPRCDIEQLTADMTAAWKWAIANQVSVLTVGADRNGAYLVVAPARHLQTLFGDECAMIQRNVKAGMALEIWVGCIGHIRVFWRDASCVH